MSSEPLIPPGELPEGEPPVNPEGGPPVNPEGEPPVNPEGRPPVNPEGGPPVNPEVEQPVNPEGEPPVNPEGRPPVNPEVEPPANPSMFNQTTWWFVQLLSFYSIIFFLIQILIGVVKKVIFKKPFDWHFFNKQLTGWNLIRNFLFAFSFIFKFVVIYYIVPEQQFRTFGLVGQIVLATFLQASNSTWNAPSLFQSGEKNIHERLKAVLKKTKESLFEDRAGQIMQHVQKGIDAITKDLETWEKTITYLIWFFVAVQVILSHLGDYFVFAVSRSCDQWILENVSSLFIFFPLTYLTTLALFKNALLWQCMQLLMNQLQRQQKDLFTKDIKLWSEVKIVYLKFGSADLKKISNQLKIIMLIYLTRYILAAVENIWDHAEQEGWDCLDPVGHFLYFYFPLLVVELLTVLWSFRLEREVFKINRRDLRATKNKKISLQEELIAQSAEQRDLRATKAKVSLCKRIIERLVEAEEDIPPSFQRAMISGLASMSIVILPLAEKINEQEWRRETGLLMVALASVYLLFYSLFKCYRLSQE